ncbi:hypothetical protein Cantr_01367 [Candida viswanathii]|jgi:CBS-domain-containing membrane protein|uniref:HPP transmembrane region domain-containing protein n=1 Tax=Candida viswanathii TaxID=5486 RepID=A0A367YHU2_9ASCO|nr:hypothetical protein Cantr_01367 [Candida viswanathii]
MVFKFTIDNVLNPFIPKNKISKLPQPLSRLLGSHPEHPVPDYFIWLEIFVGSFGGVALLEGIFKNPNVFTTYHHAPMILASYGATAILCFNASQVPLAQPRNVFIGHFIASVIGMSIQKLFSLSEAGRNHYWASGALSVAVSSVVMSIGNCVHPPAGASAMLPSVDEQVRMMSWWYLPVQIISSVLMIAVACITGNVVRRYPVYWWSPADVGSVYERREKGDEEKLDVVDSISVEEEDAATHRGTKSFDINRVPQARTITISVDKIVIPEELEIDEIEADWLEGLRSKLKQLEP